MPKRPIPFAIQYAKGRSAQSTAESLINAYAEKAPDSAKVPIRLMTCGGTEGRTNFTTPENGSSVVGCHVMNDELYAFTRTGVYKVAADGTPELLSPISLGGTISAANNGIQLVFTDGARGYYIQGDIVEQILDVDFKGSMSVCFLNGYFIFAELGTGRFFISGLYGVDFDQLEFATAEAAPDDVVAVAGDHRELWVLGKQSVEIFYDSADTDFPFQRVAGAVSDHGCAGPFAFAQGDNSLFTLSNDGIIYRYQGYAPVRVSTHEVETDIKDRDWENCKAFCFVDEGHTFIQFNFPDRTWVYDAATGLWHVRKHLDYQRHHASCYAYCYRKHWIGHFAKPQMLQMNTDYQQDDGRPLLFEGILPPLHANGEMMTFNSLEIVVEVGEGTATGEGADPKATMAFSDDNGKTWSNDREASIGKAGDRKRRVIWRRLGAARNRSFRIRMSSPVKRIVQGVAYVEVS